MRGGCKWILLWIALLAPNAAHAEEGALLNEGAVELGVAGSVVSMEGVTNTTAFVTGGYWIDALGGLGGAEIGAGYHHVSSLDRFDVEGAIAWTDRFRTSGIYPFASVTAAIRHEKIGSFSQSRYPVGLGLGVRSMLDRRAAFRVEYQWRRVLNDPVADFNEQRLVIGLSVFFRNHAGD